jgi:hypothetical protein
MADQRLPPRVKDAQDANLGAEVSCVGRDLAECRRAGLKEPRVEEGAVAIGQRQQTMRQREDDVYAPDVEQIAFAGLEPALPGLRLTLGAVPVPTGVVRDGLMPTGVTSIEVPTECGGATARDRAKD